jgi:flagellar assembly protein FliH
MQWSRAYIPKDAAPDTVMDFQPQKLELGTPKAALEYLKQKHGSDFRMNEQVQIQTGVHGIEQLGEDERIERRTVEMLETVQKSAYAEAYSLGQEQGMAKAFAEMDLEIRENLKNFQLLMQSIAHLKTELARQNEASAFSCFTHCWF